MEENQTIMRTVSFCGESTLYNLCVELSEKMPDKWSVCLLPTIKKPKVAKKKVFTSDVVFISNVCCHEAEDLVKSVRAVRQDNPIVIRGDVPVGLTARLEKEHGLVMFNPDNTAPGSSEEDKRAQLTAENFQILGLLEADGEKLQLIVDLFTDLNKSGLWASKNIAFVQSTAAELTRLTTMSFLAVKAMFLDEISKLAESSGVDPEFLKNIVSINAGIGQTSIDPVAHKEALHKVFTHLHEASRSSGVTASLHDAMHKLVGCEE